MNFNDLKPQVIDCIDSGISVELLSAPGRGKSEFVEELVKELSIRDGFQWGFTTLFLATYTPSDLMGYLVPTKREDGTLASKFTTPAWMITSEGKHINEYKRSLVFIDEYGQGEGDTKRAAAQLLLKGEVGPHKLNPGTGVIAASNRASDRSGVTKNYDFIINRRVEFTISDDIAAWKDWAYAHGVHPITLAFADQNPGIVFSDTDPAKQGPWMTPRTLVMLDKLMRAKEARTGSFPDDAATIEMAQGLVGAGAAMQYFGYVKLQREMPKYEDIIKGPSKVRVPEKPDARMLVCYNLAHRVTVEEAAPVIEYVERMPKEFAVTFASAACRRDRKLVMTPAFQAWSKTNSSLMASLGLK